MIKRTLIVFLLSVSSCLAQFPMFALWGSGVPFKVTFLTGLTPTNIVLNGAWTGPARPNEALYDSGDGIWHTYTTKNIPVSGSYVQFAGDWRTSLGTYQAMFYDTFNTTNYTCSFSGSLRYKPTNFASCYREVFRGNKAVVSIIDNPLPKLASLPYGCVSRAVK